MEGSTITIARWELYAMIAAIVLGPLIVNEAWRAATPSAATAQVVSVVRGIFAPWSRLARPWYRAGGMHVTPLISVGTIVVPLWAQSPKLLSKNLRLCSQRAPSYIS